MRTGIEITSPKNKPFAPRLLHFSTFPSPSNRPVMALNPVASPAQLLQKIILKDKVAQFLIMALKSVD